MSKEIERVYIIPREMTDEEWSEVKYNVDRKADPDIPLWRIQEAVKYSNFIAGHRGRQILQDTQQGDYHETDDTDPVTILKEILMCARAWEPDARIIGNVRAGDIAMAVSESILKLEGKT